ncbi:MAG: tRNA (adenosine(37)-N6)-threonylcarbamoyltransferase complex transferase subunit TsaD [Candidatus Berkelbacteria bacterium]|nr:tRNA (adenosine(37)-N6)-threonylcarbamoyltransferase complex transferase subunit TsaD [Candidatus Berkelbacteria bacterium]
MNKKVILAIETSCDETAASVVRCEKTRSGYSFEILSNVVASQIEIHKKWGGVYPELASRAHLESIIPVLERALTPIPEIKNYVDAVAVTVGPGLIGSLLMGVNAAQTIASFYNLAVIPINHLEGHIYSAFLGGEGKSKKSKIKSGIKNSLQITNYKLQIPKTGIFPILALIVSGGHSSLVLMDKHLSYETVGQTIDDAAGEAFDKVARILNLGYPGGPAIEKLAKSGDESAYKLPLSMLKSRDLNFSFSGLKTAVLYKTWDPKTQKKKSYNRVNLAASFQKTIVEILTQKTIQAVKKYHPKTVILSGGVSANSYLRKNFASKLSAILVPPKQLSTDNAVGIGIAGAIKFLNNKSADWSDIDAIASCPIDLINSPN